MGGFNRWSQHPDDGCVDGQADCVDDSDYGQFPMKSPGKPSLRRDSERAFWREIVTGVTSEAAAAAVGVSPAAGRDGSGIVAG